MKKHKFGGYFGRNFEFLEMLKGAEPAPDGILKSNEDQNIYYTPPCHVVWGICQTIINNS